MTPTLSPAEAYQEPEVDLYQGEIQFQHLRADYAHQRLLEHVAEGPLPDLLDYLTDEEKEEYHEMEECDAYSELTSSMVSAPMCQMLNLARLRYYTRVVENYLALQLGRDSANQSN